MITLNSLIMLPIEKQGRKRPLDTPETKIEKRARKRDSDEGNTKKYDREREVKGIEIVKGRGIERERVKGRR